RGQPRESGVPLQLREVCGVASQGIPQPRGSNRDLCGRRRANQRRAGVGPEWKKSRRQVGGSSETRFLFGNKIVPRSFYRLLRQAAHYPAPQAAARSECSNGGAKRSISRTRRNDQSRTER